MSVTRIDLETRLEEIGYTYQECREFEVWLSIQLPPPLLEDTASSSTYSRLLSCYDRPRSDSSSGINGEDIFIIATDPISQRLLRARCSTRFQGRIGRKGGEQEKL